MMVSTRRRPCQQNVDLAQSFTWLSRKALPITLTEESAIAAAAMIGDNRRPNNG